MEEVILFGLVIFVSFGNVVEIKAAAVVVEALVLTMYHWWLCVVVLYGNETIFGEG